MKNDDLEMLLQTAREDTAPLRDALRARILDDAARQAAPAPRPGRLLGWLGGFVGLPTAAVLGLWLGITQADLVLIYVPGAATTEIDALLLDDVFGATWIEGETG
ncbi:hypothetical protein SAMN05444004_10875 [Jannaschia faecimaris]|uniref:Uncharacterized protein n=1 Tax=Jannaschia faecimaris TaxID=1244108 RepID=A0A1H3RD69_9RHOB|nr:hypothetical protein [Jannaschia faecimaris]SDZ23782.1 hypothetical protein SAMN05444004_10875 [Jannaschia faecimaris]